MIIGIINFLIFFTIGVILGIYISKKMSIKALQIENDRVISDKNNNFSEVLYNLEIGQSEYKSRVNDTCYVTTSLKNHGQVDIIYFMDKNDLAIFKDNKCIYNSDGVKKEIIMDIIGNIYVTYNRKINDVVEILGFIFYREEFEKSFNIKVDDLKKLNLFNIQDQNSEIDNINTMNSNKFDIDEILDKISEFGIGILTIEERLFLDNYSNEKRN